MLRLIHIASVCILLSPRISVAFDEIGVLLVYSSDSGLSSFEKTSFAGRYQPAVDAAFITVDGSRTINILPLVTPNKSYTAANKTDKQAVSWMKSENSNVASALRVARESL